MQEKLKRRKTIIIPLDKNKGSIKHQNPSLYSYKKNAQKNHSSYDRDLSEGKQMIHSNKTMEELYLIHRCSPTSNSFHLEDFLIWKLSSSSTNFTSFPQKEEKMENILGFSS